MCHRINLLLSVIYVHVSLSSTASDIATLTTDFKFGLGTAMDKVINPFTRQDPK